MDEILKGITEIQGELIERLLRIEDKLDNRLADLERRVLELESQWS